MGDPLFLLTGVWEAMHWVDRFKLSIGVLDLEFCDICEFWVRYFTAEGEVVFSIIEFSKLLILLCTEESIIGFVGLLPTMESLGAGWGGRWKMWDPLLVGDFRTSLLFVSFSTLLYKDTELEGLSLNRVLRSLLPTDVRFWYFSLSFRKSGNSKFISVPRWSSSRERWARFKPSKSSKIEKRIISKSVKLLNFY